jgi:hypothetical protein
MPIRTKTDCRRFADAAPESRSICHLDMGDDAPDTSRQDAIAADMQKLSAEQWDWVKGEYEKSAPDRAAAAAMARQVSQAQLNSMGLQDSVTRSYIEDRENLFRPLEQGIVTSANEYDTPERREAEAGQAVADVGIQLDSARRAQTRQQQRMGVNPNSGAALATGNQMSLGEAAVKAGAANTARDNVELQGYARKMDAANLGRNIASSQATSAGVSLNQGNSAVANANMPNAVNNQGIGVMQGGANSALGGMSNAAGIYQNSTAARTQAGDNGAAMGALGSVVGGFLGGPMGAAAGGALFGPTSDENQKEGRKEVKPELSLAAIRKLPNAESWRYKDNSPAADGGQTHVGPMAQDVQASLGDAVAPAGKQIDLISMNGHLTNAVKALDKRVISLEHKRKAA